jgi:hypothetical protein
MKTLAQLVTRTQSNEARAREAVALLSALPSNDSARSSYEAAAIVFALLAINDTLREHDEGGFS